MIGIETTRWDVADHLDSVEAVLAYLEAVFEDGDPQLIAAALNDVARADSWEVQQLGRGYPSRCCKRR